MTSEAAESTPLLSDRDREFTHSRTPLPQNRCINEITTSTSVYSYVLFMPEISRKRAGHFCTFQNINACILFVLVVTLQLSLTVISGLYILENHHKWKSSVLFDERDMYPYLEKGVQFFTHPTWQAAKDSITRKKKEEECCPDSTCASSGRKCCKRGEDALVEVGSNYSALRSNRLGHAKGDGDKARGAKNSLCKVQANGNFTCSPKSLGYLDQWDKLDQNGDGVWSRVEAVEDVDNLGCQLHLSQEDLFHSVCHTIAMDTADAAKFRGVQEVVPQSLIEKKEVSRKYFDWFTGLVALCSTTSPGHCTGLLEKGVFTAAMDPEHWRGLGLRSIDDSMEYCNRLLQPGGLCGQMMPSSYSLYRSMVADKCGSLTYNLGSMYRNPHDPHDGIRILHPTFGKVGEFTETNSMAFNFFLLLLLMTWFYNSMEEMKNIGAICDLLVNFPVINVFPFLPEKYRKTVNARVSRMSVSLGEIIYRGESEHSMSCDKNSTAIECITRPHQLTLGLMVFIRGSLLLYMTVVGTVFLLSNHQYLDLLLNAVALAFIFELDEFIFTFLVSDEVKNQLEQIKPIVFNSVVPETGFIHVLFRRELWAYLVIPASALSVVLWNRYRNLTPVLGALTCLCEKQGNNCEEASRFPSSWWDDYWTQRTMGM